ncbi:mgtA regulatory leader peptide MgtL [Scandinavium tedordense]
MYCRVNGLEFAAFISLTGGCMDPDPTPHHRWSNIFSR